MYTKSPYRSPALGTLVILRLYLVRIRRSRAARVKSARYLEGGQPRLHH